MEKPKDNCCWNCALHKTSPVNLLGFCIFFERKGQERKEITQAAMDKIEAQGCKFFEEEEKEL
jgi:hypothetical protein